MTQRILGFDIARAVAIGLVVLSYLHHGIQPVGYYGVELFFALSGFLIGTILYRCLPESGKWTLAGVTNFWKRRWWRTLPNYYLFLGIAILFYQSQGQLPREGWSGILPYFIFSPHLVSPNETFFHISWSLCVEEVFYLVFPLFVLLFHRVTGSRKAAFVIAGGVIFLSSAALREVVFSQYPPSGARVATLPRLDAIGWGVAFAVLVQIVPLSLAKRSLLAATGVLLLSVIVTWQSMGSVDESAWFFRFSLLGIPFAFSLTMPLLAVWKRLPNKLEMARRPITAISLWSYSIYLSHSMVITGTYLLFGSLRDHAIINLGSKGLGLALTLLVSRWVFLHFESPLTAKRPGEQHFKIGDSGKTTQAAGHSFSSSA